MDSKTGNNPENDPFDMSLRLDTYDNPTSPQPNFPWTTIPSQDSFQNYHVSLPQSPISFMAPPQNLVPGYFDCINNCFIPAPTPTSAVPLPLNTYPTGSSSSLAKRCAECRCTYTPMWRRGPQGPRTLCNACGIRSRKEKGREKAEDRLDQPRN